MNICKLGDAERIYKNAHKGGLERPGFIRDYEILDGILERKNQIHKVVLHNYQKILIDLGSSEKRLPSGARLSQLDQYLQDSRLEQEIDLNSAEEG